MAMRRSALLALLLCIQLTIVDAQVTKPPLPPHDVITTENASKVTELTSFQHEGEAMSVAFSPDGTQLLSGGGLPILWDIQSGKKIRTFQTSNYSNPSEVGFSPDGQLVTATGKYSSEDSEGAVGILSIWNTVSGELVGSIEGYGGQESVEITNAVFSPDGQQFVIAFPPTIWNTAQVLKAGYIARSDVRRELHLQGEYGIQAAYSPDGKLFVIGSNGGALHFWDSATGIEQKSFVVENSRLFSIAFSPDGKLLASADIHIKTSGQGDTPAEYDNPVVKLWDVEIGQIVREIQSSQQTILAIAFSPNGKLLVSGSENGSVQISEVSTGKQVGLLHFNNQVIWDVAFSPDGKLIATASRDGAVRLWGVPMK